VPPKISNVTPKRKWDNKELTFVPKEMLIVETGLKVESICRERKRSYAASFMLLQLDSEAFGEDTPNGFKKDGSAIFLSQ
jgi:hypothetical protein